MLRFIAIPALALLAGAVSSLAQESPKPAPPPPPGGKEGRRFGGFGMSPFGRGPGHEGSEFNKLSEPEKKKVREALEAAWKTPEVEAARERVMKANDDFRNTMRAAVEKTDPEAAKILEKIRPPTPWDLIKDRVRLPRPEDPKFVEAAIGRLGMELLNVSKPEHRDAARKLHERVMKHPDVAAAVEKMKNAAGEARMTAFKELGEEYKKQVDAAIKEIRSKMQAAPPPEAPKP